MRGCGLGSVKQRGSAGVATRREKVTYLKRPTIRRRSNDDSIVRVLGSSIKPPRSDVARRRPSAHASLIVPFVKLSTVGNVAEDKVLSGLTLVCQPAVGDGRSLANAVSDAEPTSSMLVVDEDGLPVGW